MEKYHTREEVSRLLSLLHESSHTPPVVVRTWICLYTLLDSYPLKDSFSSDSLKRILRASSEGGARLDRILEIPEDELPRFACMGGILGILASWRLSLDP
jgi:hypothetical protein